MADGRKWGEGALGAYWRQGLAELRAAAPFADSPIAQPTDPGMPGASAAQPAIEAQRDETPTVDDNSVVGSRINQIGPPRDDRSKDDRNMDRD